MKCGFCNRKGHTIRKCPILAKITERIKSKVEAELHWDVIRNVLDTVDFLKGEIEFLHRENLLIWNEMK